MKLDFFIFYYLFIFYNPANIQIFNIEYILQMSQIKPRFFRPRLGEGNGMKWKGMKRIILEYSFLPLFGSFNGGNGKLISLFGNLSGKE